MRRVYRLTENELIGVVKNSIIWVKIANNILQKFVNYKHIVTGLLALSSNLTITFLNVKFITLKFIKSLNKKIKNFFILSLLITILLFFYMVLSLVF